MTPRKKVTKSATTGAKAKGGAPGVAKFGEIAALQRSLMKATHNKIAHTDSLQREYATFDLAKMMLESATDIMEVANGSIEKEEGLSAIWHRNERAKAYFMNLMEVGVFKAEEVLKLESDLVDANKKIKAELKKLGEKK